MTSAGANGSAQNASVTFGVPGAYGAYDPLEDAKRNLKAARLCP